MRRIERDSELAHLMAAWLDDAGLPTTDLWEGDAAYFAFGDAREPEAFGGTVRDGGLVLLRSIVVNPAKRRSGVGARIVEQLIATQPGAEFWLLTTSAEPFFARQGFTRAARDRAPAAIASSSQFRELCSASAALMHRAT